jgi:hypothetical protein
MRFRSLWWFVPDEALPLILIGGAILVILGVLRPNRVIAIVLGLAFLPLLGPIVDGLFVVLPWWIIVPVLVIIAISMFRGIAALFIGNEAADHMVGTLAAAVVGERCG